MNFHIKHPILFVALLFLGTAILKGQNNNAEEKARDLKKVNPNANAKTYEELLRSELKNSHNEVYEASRASRYRDSVRSLEFQRQGIDKTTEEKLKILIPSLEGKYQLEPKYLTAFAEVVARGIVVGESKVQYFMIPKPNGRSYKLGTDYVDIHITKVFKSRKVIQDFNVNVHDGDVIRIYNANRAFVKPEKFKRQDYKSLPYNGDEAFFFLDRNIWFNKNHKNNEFNALAVFPLINGKVSSQTARGNVEARNVDLFRSDIQSIISIIGGNDHD